MNSFWIKFTAVSRKDRENIQCDIGPHILLSLPFLRFLIPHISAKSKVQHWLFNKIQKIKRAFPNLKKTVLGVLKIPKSHSLNLAGSSNENIKIASRFSNFEPKIFNMFRKKKDGELAKISGILELGEDFLPIVIQIGNVAINGLEICIKNANFGELAQNSLLKSTKTKLRMGESGIFGNKNFEPENTNESNSLINKKKIGFAKKSKTRKARIFNTPQIQKSFGYKMLMKRPGYFDPYLKKQIKSALGDIKFLDKRENPFKDKVYKNLKEYSKNLRLSEFSSFGNSDNENSDFYGINRVESSKQSKNKIFQSQKSGRKKLKRKKEERKDLKYKTLKEEDTLKSKNEMVKRDEIPNKRYDKNLQCVICLEKIDLSRSVLACNHEFCKNCLDCWFENGDLSCPQCGFKVSKKKDFIGNILYQEKVIKKKDFRFSSKSPKIKKQNQNFLEGTGKRENDKIDLIISEEKSGIKGVINIKEKSETSEIGEALNKKLDIVEVGLTKSLIFPDKKNVTHLFNENKDQLKKKTKNTKKNSKHEKKKSKVKSLKELKHNLRNKKQQNLKECFKKIKLLESDKKNKNFEIPTRANLKNNQKKKSNTQIQNSVLVLKKNGESDRTEKIKEKSQLTEDSETDSFCYFCKETEEQEKMLICDSCNKKCSHIFCLNPPLSEIPDGDWFCDFCVYSQKIEYRLPICGIILPAKKKKKSKKRRLNNSKKDFIQHKKKVSNKNENLKRKKKKKRGKSKNKNNIQRKINLPVWGFRGNEKSKNKRSKSVGSTRLIWKIIIFQNYISSVN